MNTYLRARRGRWVACYVTTVLYLPVPLALTEKLSPFPPCVPSPFLSPHLLTERMLHRSHFHSHPPQGPSPASTQLQQDLFLNPPSWHCLLPAFHAQSVIWASTGTFIHLVLNSGSLRTCLISSRLHALEAVACRQPVSVPLDLGSFASESEVPGSRPNSVIVGWDLDHTTKSQAWFSSTVE